MVEVQLMLDFQIPLGLDNPLRIKHIPALTAFVVACRRISPARIGDIEEVTSSIQIFDDTTFDSEFIITL